jgi:hypothetical protein
MKTLHRLSTELVSEERRGKGSVRSAPEGLDARGKDEDDEVWEEDEERGSDEDDKAGTTLISTFPS